MIKEYSKKTASEAEVTSKLGDGFFYDELIERAFTPETKKVGVSSSFESAGMETDLKELQLDNVSEKEVVYSELVESDLYLSDEERETKKKEIFLNEKYPKACALVNAELAKEGKYDGEFHFDIEINEISVADLSETTLKYLEDWGDFEFGVNSPNLKSAVLREIILKDFNFIVDAKNDEDFMEYLKEINISLEECIADLQSYTERFVQESQLFRATDLNVLVNYILAEDGRWKSQFETGNSGGCLDPSYRSKREERLFGFPDFNSDEAKSTDKLSPYHVSRRPIYGYFTPDKNGILNYSGTQPPYNITINYGKVHCKVKESKRNEITISFGDSLFADFAMTPLIKPHYTSLSFDPTYDSISQHRKLFDVSEDKKRFIKKINVTNLYQSADGYTETQIHNGLRMEDIESLHVSQGNDLSYGDIQALRLAVDKYNARYPNSSIELIVY